MAKTSIFFISDVAIESCTLIGEMIRRPRYTDPMFEASQNMQLGVVTYNNISDSRS
jgi:hypothetical protein